jgi:uncharacterized membrane protein YGL010W
MPQQVQARDWLARYNESHQHPVNRACHTVGIPMIVLSVVLAGFAFVNPALWWPVAGLFVAGWVLQFIGHWFEGKPPAFLADPRFLLTGLKWWAAKLRRRH